MNGRSMQVATCSMGRVLGYLTDEVACHVLFHSAKSSLPGLGVWIPLGKTFDWIPAAPSPWLTGAGLVKGHARGTERGLTCEPFCSCQTLSYPRHTATPSLLPHLPPSCLKWNSTIALCVLSQQMAKDPDEYIGMYCRPAIGVGAPICMTLFCGGLGSCVCPALHYCRSRFACNLNSSDRTEDG